uniref:ATPase AAA-type core domain-containing protein n=1 Tax=Pavo cristatus TaxID=9049 RepID=A0A8C9L5V5_PAVCR
MLCGGGGGRGVHRDPGRLWALLLGDLQTHLDTVLAPCSGCPCCSRVALEAPGGPLLPLPPCTPFQITHPLPVPKSPSSAAGSSCRTMPAQLWGPTPGRGARSVPCTRPHCPRCLQSPPWPSVRFCSVGDVRTLWLPASQPALGFASCSVSHLSPTSVSHAAPKPKRQRLEAVKKLNFGGDGVLAPDVLQDAVILAFPSPELEVSGLRPLESSPPTENPKRVLKRPPVLGDYINVTSSEGTRVFMAVRDDPSQIGMEVRGPPSSSGLRDSVGWNRPLHLLGVPFSYLKEQVWGELPALPPSVTWHVFTPPFSCLETSDEATEQPGDMGEEEPTPHCLWVDKFAPRRYMELLSDDYTNRCLLKWLKLWDTVVFGKEKPVKKAKPGAEAHPPFRQPKEPQNKWKTKAQLTEEILEAELDQHKRPKYKVALLCGPPGLGKTTLAHVIAQHAGYNVVEMNASDDRSPETFKTRIEAATQMKSVLGAEEKPNCLIIDEIDGAPTVRPQPPSLCC